ncbi:MAG: NAD-dependent dehydratase [Algicola sp.]|nr:NAD-dependent dehydratase [Algicola sp.]
MNKIDGIKAALYSLSFVWIFTGLTSIFFSPQIGYDLLASNNIIGVAADIAVYSGGILDILLGLWLLTGKRIKRCCIIQIAVIVAYTVLLTLIDASFWLHPFGPLTKNLPIIVLIGWVYSQSASLISPE